MLSEPLLDVVRLARTFDDLSIRYKVARFALAVVTSGAISSFDSEGRWSISR